MIQGKLTIESNIPERDFMESLLNMVSSGIDYQIPFCFHAMANDWKINKLAYYNHLLLEVGCTSKSPGAKK